MCQLNRFLDSELWHQYVIKRILHSNMQMNTQHLPRQKFFPNISLRLHTSAWTVETSPYHSSFSSRRIATDRIQYQHCDYKIRLQRRFGAVEERWTLISNIRFRKTLLHMFQKSGLWRKRHVLKGDSVIHFQVPFSLHQHVEATEIDLALPFCLALISECRN
jgi:hypothetical protein